ncbi:gluconolactonase [Catalinimonas alkaloidigena]|uniref:Gluconolactonase n=1 Tax=Catalinimonas alkaloidigena TaxID=1075417 RepID=A0A1G9UEN6_9BACT|nr:SMP-30/gluconolactonase/LRE family protein [Catalinimonas alkaloidigena]SDM58411.1 gluconolactonase [Catalinimonas alkaloidigena]
MSQTTTSASRVADGAPLHLVSDQFKFTEGPSVDAKGNVYFTDQPNNTIWKYDTDGQLSVFMEKAGRANGTFFDRKGNMIVCADEHNQLWSISPKGKVTVLLDDFQGHRFNGPNDVWVAPNGGLYFTDPYFQRDYWERTSPDPGIGGEKLYYLAPGAKEARRVDNETGKPNGVVGTADGKFLYVADMSKKTVFRYRIEPDGSLADKQPFAEEMVDGMTVDTQGNLYLAGNGVTIYSPSGEKLEHIDVPQPWTANVCFGGKNRDQLFITASKAAYTLRMRAKGARP